MTCAEKESLVKRVAEIASEYRKVDEFYAAVKREILAREWQWAEPRFQQLFDEVRKRRKESWEAIAQYAEALK
jgi:hypothetical protein